MSSRFWERWLIVATSLVAAFGLLIVVSPPLANWLFGWVAFGSASGIENLGAAAQPYLALVHGVLGAVMFGWGVGLLLVVLGPFSRSEWEGWRTIAVSLASWFAVDTALSAVTGFWGNVALNVGFALLFAVPLAATYSDFKRAHT
jgi:hypothetical protein